MHPLSDFADEDLVAGADLPPDVSKWGEAGARYSPDRLYRWSFEKRWAEGFLICWIGLNPGTGDTERRRRPTLERMVTWSLRLGGGAIVIVNLFAYRTTHPSELRSAWKHGLDIVGSKNDQAIEKAIRRADKTVVAWGHRGSLQDRGIAVAARVPDPLCLGLTASGQPLHPLYVPLDARVMPYGLGDRLPRSLRSDPVRGASSAGDHGGPGRHKAAYRKALVRAHLD